EQNAREQAALPQLDRGQLTRMRIGKASDPDGVAERTQDVELRGYDLWADLERVLSEHYLADVSPVVADDFRSALSAWRRKDDAGGAAACAERFAQMASLLTRSRDVIQLVAEQPWRELPSLPFQT